MYYKGVVVVAVESGQTRVIRVLPPDGLASSVSPGCQLRAPWTHDVGQQDQADSLEAVARAMRAQACDGLRAQGVSKAL